MRAVVLRKGRLVLDEVADPVPAPGQVLVKTLTNGICGSDLHSLEMAEATPEAMESTVLGHEFCAEVLDYGPATTERPFSIGSRVCANPFTAAGGLVNPGGLAEMMVLDVDRAVGVPEHVAARPGRPDGAAGGRDQSGRRRRVPAGRRTPHRQRVWADRAGRHYRPAGPGTSVPSSPPTCRPSGWPWPRSSAWRWPSTPGRDSAFDHLSEFGFTPAKISALLQPGAPDRLGVTIYECSGAHGMIHRLMETAPAHSSIVVAGISMAPDSISAITGIRRELTIGYALAYRPEEVALSLQRIAEGKVDTSALVTAIVPLAETPWAFEALRKTEQVKILIEPGR